MHLHQAVNKFLDACRNEFKLAEKTNRAYAYDLGQFHEFMQPSALHQITTKDIDRYLQYLDHSQDLKSSTIRRKVMTLKAFFNFFMDRGTILASPVDSIKYRLTSNNNTPKVLNAQDMMRLLDFLREDVTRLEGELRPGCGRKVKLHYENAIRDRAIIELLFSTAMRIGELAELNICDIDLEIQAVHIKGKGNRNRTLVIGSNESIEAMKAYLIIRRSMQGDANALFLNRFGGRLSIFAVENLFERIRKSAGIHHHLTPHALRYTMAAMLLNNGKDIKQVRNILGHSSIVTTQTYQAAAPRPQRRVMASLNEHERLSVQKVDGMPRRRPRTVRRRKGEKGIPLSSLH